MANVKICRDFMCEMSQIKKQTTNSLKRINAISIETSTGHHRTTVNSRLEKINVRQPTSKTNR